MDINKRKRDVENETDANTSANSFLRKLHQERNERRGLPEQASAQPLLPKRTASDLEEGMERPRFLAPQSIGYERKSHAWIKAGLSSTQKKRVDYKNEPIRNVNNAKSEEVERVLERVSKQERENVRERGKNNSDDDVIETIDMLKEGFQYEQRTGYANARGKQFATFERFLETKLRAMVDGSGAVTMSSRAREMLERVTIDSTSYAKKTTEGRKMMLSNIEDVLRIVKDDCMSFSARGGEQGKIVDVVVDARKKRIKGTKEIEIPSRGRKWVNEKEIIDRQFGSDELRILSYNIWFDASNAIMDRTEYLAKVIEDSDPDVLCLQEVTLQIFFVLQGQEWFEKYNLCSQPSETELQLGYFCCVLVKNSSASKASIDGDGNIFRTADNTNGGFREGSWKVHKSSFQNSIMGRNLQYAYGLGSPKLAVATSHLESWIMQDPKGMAEKRKQQLIYSLNHLGNRFDDVVFIGDMNWNDSKDGACPVNEPWEDAWMKLRPESDDGYTYDAKRNTMLRGNLCARFDRAFCKLKNYSLESIQMVGTNPEINGKTFERPYIEKGEHKKIKVDVLPSDHYGLLLRLKKIEKKEEDQNEIEVVDLT
jgi:hypothetical protein